MKKEPLSKEVSTAIILATEELFKLKFKVSVDEKRKYLHWEDLLQNKNISRLLITKKTAVIKGQKQAFLSMVREALINHPLYSILDLTAKNKEKVSVIKRNCIYDKIQNMQTLVRFVFSHVTGTVVDEQLLSFTYPSISKDIQSAINQNLFVKMNLISKNVETYHLFPNLEVQQFGINDWESNKHQGEYLSICKQFGKKEERVFEQSKNFQIVVEVDESDLNYKLPGFLQLKKEWKIKQALKVAAREEEDRKAQLKEKEDAMKN